MKDDVGVAAVAVLEAVPRIPRSRRCCPAARQGAVLLSCRGCRTAEGWRVGAAAKEPMSVPDMLPAEQHDRTAEEHVLQ